MDITNYEARTVFSILNEIEYGVHMGHWTK